MYDFDQRNDLARGQERNFMVMRPIIDDAG
jgi:hypothetical protein